MTGDTILWPLKISHNGSAAGLSCVWRMLGQDRLVYCSNAGPIVETKSVNLDAPPFPKETVDAITILMDLVCGWRGAESKGGRFMVPPMITDIESLKTKRRFMTSGPLCYINLAFITWI